MTTFVVNPKTGKLETADDPKPAATPESVREYRRKLRETLNPPGDGWHKDDLGPKPKAEPAEPHTTHSFPVLEEES